MKLLADENIDAEIVAWLRAQNHEVLWACEVAAGYSDPALLKIAQQEHRVVVTGDLDFGDLVFRQRLAPEGVILLRVRSASQSGRLQALQRHWPSIIKRLPGSFVTVVNSRIRVRPIPPLGS